MVFPQIAFCLSEFSYADLSSPTPNLGSLSGWPHGAFLLWVCSSPNMVICPDGNEVGLGWPWGAPSVLCVMTHSRPALSHAQPWSDQPCCFITNVTCDMPHHVMALSCVPACAHLRHTASGGLCMFSCLLYSMPSCIKSPQSTGK